MSRIRQIIFVLFLGWIAIIPSCISPVDIDPPLGDRLLVVEGFITDEFGPHEIRLSRLARFAGSIAAASIFPVFDAQVFITDQNDERTDLVLTEVIVKSIDRGVFAIPPFPPRAVFRSVNSGYRTPDTFRAIPGNSYVLNIITVDGTLYQSSPQSVNVGPEIDSLILDFKKLPSTDPLSFNSGFDILSQFQDPVEEQNFYSWIINGTYLIETPNRPALPGEEGCLFDPGDNCCSRCWIEEKNIEGNTLAFSDALANGSQITQTVGFVQDDGIRFANTSISAEKQYWVEVEQHTISAEAFGFYRVLQSQLEIGGGIFDPPPANIGGNIFRVNNPEEEVLGFFSANSVKRASVFIQRSDIEDPQRPQQPCGDCRIRNGATLETPEPYR